MKRIQRKRTKGWRMPENAKYVGRPTKWGNPYKAGDLVSTVPLEIMHGAMYWSYAPDTPISEGMAIDLYREWLKVEIASGDLDLSELEGKDLACWCSLDKRCHADVILEMMKEQNNEL